MAAYPTTKETTVATIVGPQPKSLWPLGMSLSSKSPAPTTAGIARRKANRVAASRLMPRKRPIEMVAPDLDTPGTRAAACASPRSTASRRPTSLNPRLPDDIRSATPRTSPSRISARAITHRFRRSRSMTFLRSTPRTTIGSDPTMTYQPIRASRWPRYSGLNNERTQAEPIRQMSWRK
jgi:hypothetical protein